MNPFRTAAFRVLAFGLALPLAALALAGCDVDSVDSTTSLLADNEGNVYNYSGLYMNTEQGSTNGYGALVFPEGKQSGAVLIWLRLLQYGSVLEGYDSAGLTWSGKISAQNGEVATFSLQGKTTAAQAVEIFGTLAYASQQSTMDATWIEPAFAGSIFAQATVAPVVTNSPVPTNVTGNVTISPTSASLATNGQSQAFTATGGSGSYAWTFSGTGGTLSSSAGSSVTFTRNSTGSGVIQVSSSGDSATASISCP